MSTSKIGKTKIDPNGEIEAEVKRPGQKKKPRATPLSFGYMRLDPANPYLSVYRQMLQDAGISELFDDTPAVPQKRPQFRALLAKARPNDTIVLVRFNHFSTNEQVVMRCIQSICDARLNIRLVQNATKDFPDTAAVLLNFMETILPKMNWIRCGGDGGGGNGGP